MTCDVITVTETTELDEVADLLETKRVKRVPLVRDGKVIGIISRADLVRALTTAKSLPSTDTDADDRTIRARLLAELQGQEWAKVQAGDVIVRDKVVHLWCSDDKSEEVRQALRVAAENTPGIRGVEEHIVPTPYSQRYSRHPQGPECRDDGRQQQWHENVLVRLAAVGRYGVEPSFHRNAVTGVARRAASWPWFCKAPPEAAACSAESLTV
jgi:CBS domain-containing protein